MALVRYIERGLISGRTLRQQRTAAGLSQQQLADLITKQTGIVIARQRISEMESAFESEIDYEMALAIQSAIANPVNHCIKPEMGLK